MRRRRIRVLGVEGRKTTVCIDADTVVVVALPGAIVRGTTYCHETLLSVSPNYADHLVEQGSVRVAEIVRS